MTERELPIEFVARMRAQLGEEAEDFFQSLSLSPATSIVLNPCKPSGHRKEGSPVPWHPHGRYLPERPSYVMDPHYHAGAYYSQEASSMLVHAVVKQLPLQAAPLCLDLCAAPGGKSIALLEAMPEAGFLIANEVIKARSRILIENLRKWGRVNWLPASGHPSRWKAHEELFDLILVDAPCSGEGMFRKEPKALSEWSEENVTFCAQRQSSILSDIAPCVKEGGFLIYSTCTYSEAENQERLEQLSSIGFTPYALDLEDDWGFVSEAPNTAQAYPHRVRGEGFFLSVFVKREHGSTRVSAKESNSSQVTEPLSMKVPEGFTVERKGDETYLLSTRFDEPIRQLSASRLLLERGMMLGSYKADKFIPSHYLAMSGLLIDTQAVDIDLERAIKFLRRETFPIEVTEDGWYLMQYEGTTLGWAKVAAGRMKNHYPKEWMIRKRW